MATSNGPCLRVSQGSVPVSAKLAVARLPASCAAFAKIIEPNVAGGRNTTWPSPRCGASSLEISGCAKAGAGHRISSTPRTASAMSVVTSASCTSCRPLESLTTMREPAARCSATAPASRRHSRTSWPCNRKIARGRERAVAAAEYRDLQMASPCEVSGVSSCLSMKCWTLPSAVRGRSSTKTISRGTLKRASCVSTCARNSSASTEHPVRLMT